jgi:hypothetical protein
MGLAPSAQIAKRLPHLVETGQDCRRSCAGRWLPAADLRLCWHAAEPEFAHNPAGVARRLAVWSSFASIRSGAARVHCFRLGPQGLMQPARSVRQAKQPELHWSS